MLYFYSSVLRSTISALTVNASRCLLFLLLTGCQVNSTRVNVEEDKKAAELFVDAYLINQKQGHQAAMIQAYSKEVWTVTPQEKMQQLFRKRGEVLGRLQHAVLADWQSKVVTGSNPSSTFQLQYKNQYEKGEALETFGLRTEHDSLKIINYNIQSDAFLR
ncbi:hypothetical protein E5K00_20630 [Hymenobacter aquaticus]|uniref:Nuclear transport factor 2 family protein n=1 Tax=Hymenobacter aquaticus TaxID=1867101 RepID=A0A4Z0PSG3_9BACT|nr:hypothetical protein [Hymenobacter aquaticus]TGE20405.1 hypothetical protein E5K00_20630 [Hymenobacter aquaticus]